MTRAKRSESTPQPQQTFGAGYLYHYHPIYQDFADRLARVGGEVDIYEVLAVQFNSEPDAIERFAASLAKPVTLHSFEYALGNVHRPPQKVQDRIQELAKRSKSAYIGEHVAVMGTRDYYCGGFLQPPGTDEQTQVLIDNIKTIKASSVCPIIIENPSQFYNHIGPRTIGQQMRDVAEHADVGILLSLSNITISDRFHPQDREAMLADIPLDRIRQIHALCGNLAEEQQPGMEKSRDNQRWILSTLEALSKRAEIRPAAVIFELEAGTQSMAEPERLRDLMLMARDLYFSDQTALRTAAAKAAAGGE